MPPLNVHVQGLEEGRGQVHDLKVVHERWPGQSPLVRLRHVVPIGLVNHAGTDQLRVAGAGDQDHLPIPVGDRVHVLGFDFQIPGLLQGQQPVCGGAPVQILEYKPV